MDVVEPYLLELGFLDRTPRGVWRRAVPTSTSAPPYPETIEQPGLFEQKG